MYREKDRPRPHHSIAASRLVALAPSSLSKSTSKYPLVRRDTELKGVGRWSLRQSNKALNVALPPRVLPMTVRLAFFAALSCISTTKSVGKSAYISNP